MNPNTAPWVRPAGAWCRWVPRMVCAGLLMCTLGMPVSVWAAELVAIMISRPQHGETIHDNTGAVPVAVALHGATLGADKRLRVLIDGNPYVADQRALEFTLKGIERGEHHLQVQLLDDAGRVLATSLTSTFQVWQASSLFPGRKPDTRSK